MTWELAHSLVRLVLSAIIVVKVTKFSGTLNRIERSGLGIMAGCGLLTIHVIWERQQSPYDGWAGTLFSLGAILFLAGRTYRDWCHDYNNTLQVRLYEQEKRARGKA